MKRMTLIFASRKVFPLLYKREAAYQLGSRTRGDTWGTLDIAMGMVAERCVPAVIASGIKAQILEQVNLNVV